LFRQEAEGEKRKKKTPAIWYVLNEGKRKQYEIEGELGIFTFNWAKQIIDGDTFYVREVEVPVTEELDNQTIKQSSGIHTSKSRRRGSERMNNDAKTNTQKGNSVIPSHPFGRVKLLVLIIVALIFIISFPIASNIAGSWVGNVVGV